MRLPFRRKSTVSLVANYVGGVPQWPPRNYRTYALEGMAKSPSVYGCMAARAQSASEIRLKVQQLIGKDWVDADDTTKRTPDATALQELIDNPNPLQSQSLYLQDVIQSLDFAGNSYTQIELSKSGQPIALWHLDRPDVMAIVPDPVKKIAGYVYNPGGAPIPIPPTEIIHHRHLSDPLNPLLGLPPMAVAARDIDVDNATTDFLKQFFDRGGVPAWAAMFQTAVDDKTAKEFVAKWEQKFSISQGGNAAGGIATLNARDVKLEKVGYGTSTRESGLTDIRMVIDARICSAFRVHPQVAFSLLGFLHPTYAQARMAQEMTWQMGLCPLYVRLADQTTISLRPYYPNCRVVADFSQVKALQEDESGLWTRHLNAAQEGYETREEFREAVGLPNEPKGTFLVPFKYVEQQPGEPLAPRVAVSESATVTAADITQQQETGEGNDDNPDTPNTPAGVPPPVSATERVATGRGKPPPKPGQQPAPAPGQKGGNAGNADSLRQWFVDGADGAISWGSHGDFEQCVAVAGKYMDDAEGYCNLRHQEAVGGPPGSEGKAVATRTRPKAVKAADDDDAEDDPHVQSLDSRLRPLAAALLGGTITRAEFIAHAQRILSDGIQRAASSQGATAADAAQIADDLLSSRGDYLDSYASDLDAADADTGKGLLSRVALWAGLAWTGAMAGRVAGGDDDTQYDWVCKDDANSCDDCEANAEGGPYARDDLPGYPGDGSTQCNGNCRCELREHE